MIPAMAPNQSIPCAICGAMGNPDTHHEIHRSLGGTDGPTLHACRRCHQNLHPEKTGGPAWSIAEHSKERLAIVNGSETVMERWYPPEDFQEGPFLAGLRRIPEAFRVAHANYFRYLSDDGMVEAAEILNENDAENWQALAKLLQIAKFRMPYGDRTEKFAELVRVFGIRKSRGYKLVAALSFVEDRPELFHASGNLNPDAVLLIAAHGDPEAAATLLADRVAQNPRYGARELSQELAAGNTDSLRAPPAWCVCTCPHCGAETRHLRRTP